MAILQYGHFPHHIEFCWIASSIPWSQCLYTLKSSCLTVGHRRRWFLFNNLIWLETSIYFNIDFLRLQSANKTIEMFTVEFTKYHGQAAQSLPEKNVCLDVPDLVWSNYIIYKSDFLRWKFFLLLRSLWSSSLFIIHLVWKPPFPLAFLNWTQETRAANASAASKWPIAWSWEVGVFKLAWERNKNGERNTNSQPTTCCWFLNHPIWKICARQIGNHFSR